MTRFGPDHYVPVLLTKMGERDALRDCDAAVKRRLTPLFVVSPIDWDFDADAPKKGVGEHIAKLPEQLVASWGTDPAFVDTAFLPDDEPMPDGSHPLTWLVTQAAARGLELIAVLATDRGAGQLDAVAALPAQLREQVALRLPISSWPSIAGYADVDAVLTRLGLAPEQVHIVLDVADDPGPAALAATLAEVRALRDLDRWRTLTVASASMPAVLPPGAGVHVLPRDDWAMYRAIAAAPSVPRMPTYGDYAVAHPDPVSDVDPRVMNISATLRYSTRDSWLIAKGGLFKGNGGRGQGGAAVPPACNALIGHPGFMAGHCGFEAWVDAARSGGPTGNAGTWRRQATRHHLHLVTEQIATPGGP